MANVSDVWNGILTIQKNFYEENKDFLDDYFKEENFAQVYYGFRPFSTFQDDGDYVFLEFEGNGKWSLQASYSFAFQGDHSEETYRKFIKLLYDKNQEVQLTYEEYEPGCCILGEYTDRVFILKNDETGNLFVSSEDLEVNNYGYNDFNLIYYGFEEGIVVDSPKDITFGEEWYNNLEPKVQEKYSKEEALQLLCEAIQNSSDTDGAICEWRYYEHSMVDELFFDYVGEEG